MPGLQAANIFGFDQLRWWLCKGGYQNTAAAAATRSFHEVQTMYSHVRLHSLGSHAMAVLVSWKR